MQKGRRVRISEDDLRVYRFPSSFRLKRRRLIRPLFQRGGQPKQSESSLAGTIHTIGSGSVRLLFRFADRAASGQDRSHQIGFAVPKRVRRAVDRNIIKRQLRVAYQTSKHKIDALPIADNAILTIMVLFRGDVDDFRKACPDARNAFDKLHDSIIRITGN